jgi:hypothetical protein
MLESYPTPVPHQFRPCPKINGASINVVDVSDAVIKQHCALGDVYIAVGSIGFAVLSDARLASAHGARRGFTPLVAGKRLSESVPDQHRCAHVPLRGMPSDVIENYIHRLMDGNLLRRTNCTLRIKHVTRACNIPGACIVKMSLFIRSNIANIEQFAACLEGCEVLGKNRGDPQQTRRKNKRHQSHNEALPDSLAGGTLSGCVWPAR